ncbi:hypothetical protein PPYR_07002 [Photinus pyralis]|uniref:AMP-dependent synthetase/ligase domain-containing protein n=1 Tax=Photinus pyralis TaxID=7054 RepID=A0A1Y1KEJ1_PHOPY|nr:4-coumarate--CoA ligase-like 7 [Photinus pyralis]KAB0799122.1 hypothetical protein PPYR_07002 [Photinus pyralis]
MYRTALNNSPTSLRELIKIGIKKKFYSTKPCIVQSPFQKIEIPDATVPDFIFENCGKFPDKIATECASTGRKYTYDELRTKSLNLSRALKKRLKLRKGDVVAILLPNIPEFGICLLGILKSSLIATTLSPLNTPEELKRQLSDSNTRAVITTCSLHPLASASLPTPDVPIISIKTERSDAIPAGSANFQEFTNCILDLKLDEDMGSTDVALMPYSSGTTGSPKGVLHTHRSLVANLSQINIHEVKILETATADHQDIVPAVPPFIHMYGLVILMLNGFMNMSKLVTVPKFKPNVFVDILERYKPTALFAVPTLISFMTNSEVIKRNHLESVRMVASASAPLSAAHQEQFIRKVGKDVCVVQGFGTSESGLVTSSQKHSENQGSVGAPLPNTEIRVVAVDAPNADQQPFQQGELLFKGPQLMHGYHNRPEEYSKAFTDGWMRTGDLVYYDDNRNFYIVDRLKDLIKVKGYQVSPAELEDVIRSHSNVSDATVIGIPHERYGEVPRAYITVKSGSQINTDELKQFVSSKVSNYKDIKGGIVVVDYLPKNIMGKLLRRKLKLDYMHSIGTRGA